jgi:monofunctional biosynthetic peptidoglycan transglycosylase
MFKKTIKFIYKFFATIFISSVLFVIIFKYIPPPITPAMTIAFFEYMFEGKFVGIDKKWCSYADISPNFFRALISSEDGKFLRHKGFDWEAIETAKHYNEAHKGKKKRGASTISMQTSKNTFLWHDRNWARKALEAYFTIMIENVWGKKRILEMYANVVEFGNGLYGVEEASHRFFGKSASELNKNEAALLVAVLPNPHRWTPSNPTDYILKRVNFIEGRMGGMALPKE